MPKEGIAYQEIGVTGLNKWGYPGSTQYEVAEDFLRVLRGQKGVKIFTEMSENDPIIGGILYVFEQLIKQIPWYVSPEDDADAEFLRQCMDDMEYSWSEFIDEVSTFLVYGFAWFEIVYKHRAGKRSKFDDGKIGWAKFAPRAQSSLSSWEFDKHGEVTAFVQTSGVGKTVTIGLQGRGGFQKSLHFITKSRRRNPEGKSVLRNAYRPWYFKKRIEELEGIGIERDLTGLPMLKPPQTTDLNDPKHATTKSWVQTLIRNIRRGHQEGFVLPYDWEFELLSSPGKRQIDVGEVITRLNKQISMSCLSQFLMLGMERVGSYGLSESLTALFDRCLEGWALRVAEIVNRYAIPSLFKMNGIVRDKYPSLMYGTITQESLREVSGYLLRLSKVVDPETGESVLDIDDELKDFVRRFGVFKNSKRRVE